VTARQPSTRTKDRLEGSFLSLLVARDSHRVGVKSRESRVESQGSRSS
jgi:hypothetical protein